MLCQKMNPKKIISKLNKVYQEESLSDTQMYNWIAEICFCRKDISNQKSTGRPCEKFDDFIFKQLENNPHVKARMTARRSGNALSTILSHLKDSLNMKCLHLEWIPHSFNSFQKRKRVLLSNSLLKQLDFGLFGTMKNSFTGCELETDKELIKAINNFLEEKPKEFWMPLFHEWQRRLR